MRKRLKLLPDGLASRLSAMLFLSLLVAHVFAAGALMWLQAGIERETRTAGQADRLSAFVGLLEHTGADLRNSVAAQSNTRLMRLSVDERPLVASGSGPTDELISSLEQNLPGHQVLSASEVVGEAGSFRLISLSLEGGGWLNVRLLPGDSSAINLIPLQVLAIFIVSLLITFVIGNVFVRQISLPLRKLEEAAELAGKGNRTARVSEGVPREVRAANIAFNEMQARIAGFEEERMRQLAAVGHDLRTPITGLRINCEMVEDDETREEMLRSLDVMTVIADELALFGRGQNLSETLEDTDLEELALRICRSQHIEAVTTGPMRIRMRPVAITRAINNLIDNAVRYAGPPRLHLERSATGYQIRIDDNGPGLPAHMLTAALEPFTRGENSRNATTGGIGLGLSIARSIVHLHDGTLRLENREGSGLSAIIELPAP